MGVQHGGPSVADLDNQVDVASCPNSPGSQSLVSMILLYHTNNVRACNNYTAFPDRVNATMHIGNQSVLLLTSPPIIIVLHDIRDHTVMLIMKNLVY